MSLTVRGALLALVLLAASTARAEEGCRADGPKPVWVTESPRGYDQKIHVFLHDFRGNDAVIPVKPDADYACGRSAHRPDIVFIEPDGLSMFRDEHDVIIAIGRSYPSQFIVRIDPDRDHAGRSDGLEEIQTGPLHLPESGREEEIG